MTYTAIRTDRTGKLVDRFNIENGSRPIEQVLPQHFGADVNIYFLGVAGGDTVARVVNCEHRWTITK